ncbi:hypothetical protein [Paenibacillus protaetiae]|uniref:Uncharacterized protein n=1 Tax=Paenibacillus protaetiae TaxID=2509456 RepID=A0A4P6EX66_9BACL|nr:hypothetical protein [Paenibacillus protaetiae]QAY66329.1 hypothetical protein ET464_07850 [Paenibacillus protaetiae]
MDSVEIRALFGGPEAAQEAIHKLQALRALDVAGLPENGMLTVVVDRDIADRASRLIQQIGGDLQTIF